MTQSDRAFHALARHEPEVGSRSLLHLECQGYCDEGFAERLFRYHLLLTPQHPDRLVRTVALWLTRPPAAQRRTVLSRGDVTLRVTHVVLSGVRAARLPASPQTACFAPGADPGPMRDEALCDAVARALASTDASWYQRHTAVITAHTRGRYEVMTRAMPRAGIEPILIEDTLRIGEHRGVAKGAAQATAEATLTLIDARGLALTAAQRAQVRACADVDALKRWFKRALTAASAAEVFAAPEAASTRRRPARAR